MPPFPISIAWPMAMLVVLIATVWVQVAMIRLNEFRERGADQEGSKRSGDMDAIPEKDSAIDNLNSLFKEPTLFFIIATLDAVTDHVTRVQLYLAWVFVGLRYLHSAISFTYNDAQHKAIVYVLSMLCMFAMWLIFVKDLWRGY